MRQTMKADIDSDQWSESSINSSRDSDHHEMAEEMKMDADVDQWSVSNVNSNRCQEKVLSKSDSDQMSEKLKMDDNCEHRSVANNKHDSGQTSEKMTAVSKGHQCSVSNNNHDSGCNGSNVVNNNNNNNNNNDFHKKSKVTSRSKVDGRWSWVVLTATVLACIISGGQLQSINIYYLIFLEEFKQSSSFTAWVSAAQGTSLCVAGPLVSFLLPKLGSRLTIVTGAILMASCYASVFFADSIPFLIVVFFFVGASECLMSGGNMAAVASYFPRRSSFATGIMFAGGGLGSMVLGMQLEWSVGVFGWRGAMLIQAAIVLQICICGCLVLRPLAESKVEQKQNGVAVIGGDDGHSEEKQVSDRTSLKSLSLDPHFWTFVASFMAFSAQFSTMMTIFKGFVVSVGLESSFAIALTTSSVGNMAGKALGGPMSELLPAPIHLTAVGLACALANSLYTLVDQPWTLAVVAGAFGLCQGHLTIVWLLNVAWVYGPKEMPVVRGYIMFFAGICALSFPPIAGYTVDLTGSYATAMMMSSASCLVIAFCALVTYAIHRRTSSSSSNRSYDVTRGLRPSPLAPPCVQLVHYALYVPI